MKHIVKVVVVLGLLLPALARADLQVFACEPEWLALARAIGGEKVTGHSATTAAQDPHHIQARPSLIAKLRRADMLICSGAELEAGWLPVLLRRSRNPGVQPGRPGHVMAAMLVSRLEIPTHLDRSEGDVHAQGNPHVHLDPRRLLQIAEMLAVRMAQLDSANADAYRAGFDAFRARWQAAIADWASLAEPVRGKRAVVHHKEWVYLFDWLGMQRAAALEPKPGLPPTVGHLAQLKQQVGAGGVHAIVRAPVNDARPAEWLAKETGLPILELPHTVEEPLAGDALFRLFDDIVAALTRSAS